MCPIFWSKLVGDFDPAGKVLNSKLLSGWVIWPVVEVTIGFWSKFIGDLFDGKVTGFGELSLGWIMLYSSVSLTSCPVGLFWPSKLVVWLLSRGIKTGVAWCTGIWEVWLGVAALLVVACWLGFGSCCICSVWRLFAKVLGDVMVSLSNAS